MRTALIPFFLLAASSMLNAAPATQPAKHLTDWRDNLARDGTLKEITLDGYRYTYADTGKGPAIILLHGLGGSIYDWRGNLKPLADAGHRVIALDMLGAGESDQPAKADYGVVAQARRVRGLMDALKIDRATFVGNSYGGGVSLAFAEDYPERIDRLVLIDTIAYPEQIPSYVALCSVPWLPEQVSGLVSVDRMVSTMLHDCYADSSRLGADDVRNYTRELTPDARRRAVIHWVRDMVPADATEFLARMAGIKTKTLIVWGDRDGVRPVEHGRRLAKDLPDACLVVLENVGHMPNMEVPDKVNTLLTDFLRK